MEGAVGRVQAVYQSMLKEHEVSTNAVEVGITVKNREKECQFLWEYGSVELPKGLA